MKIQYRLITWLFLIAAAILPVQAQTRPAYQTHLIPPVEIDHETATLTVRFIVEENGIMVRDITPASIRIDEPASDIQVSATAERALTLAILVDLSFGSDADLVRATLRAFFDNYFVEGDQVTLYVLDANSASSSDVQVIPITDREQAVSTLDALARSERLFSMRDALNRAYEDLTALPEDPLTNRQALYVGSLLNRPDDAQETARFADSGIMVHGVQAHRTRETQTTIFRGLANQGGGLFANNFNGVFVIPGDTYQPINNLKLLYDIIASNRLIYTLTYRTFSQSLSATRPVTLSITLPSGAVTTLAYEYEWEFQAPEVTFTSTRDFAIGRTPFLREDGTIGFEPRTRAVPVQISFPDGVARRIESVRLEVLEANSSTVLQSELLLQPELDANGGIALEWELDEYTVQGSTQNIRIQVTVTDELGITGAASVEGNVQVSVLPPTPTPPPTETPVPVATATPVAAETSTQTAATSANVLQSEPNMLLILANVMLILLVLLLLVRGRRLRREQHERDEAEHELPRQPHVVPAEATEERRQQRTWPGDRIEEAAAPQSTASNNGDAPASASAIQYKLVLREGHEQLNMREVLIDVDEFVIGRTSDCNLVIDLPTVSNRHCAIRIDPRRGVFVRDLGSINGTFINGDRLRSGEESYIPLGSELWITKAHIFEIWDAEKEVQISKDEEQAKLSTLYISAESVPFKPLPGLRYAPDDGDPIDDDYAPL